MLQIEHLKTYLHGTFSKEVKLLIVLASFNAPVSISKIKTRALEAGFKVPPSWNPSLILSRSKGRAIKVPTGWEIHQSGIEQLKSLGIIQPTTALVEKVSTLRKLLSSIEDEDRRNFLNEVLKACENNMFRSCLVMSWLAAIYVLQTELITNHLKEFNKLMQSIHQKWKPVKRRDDLRHTKESEQLDRMCKLGLFDSATNKELQQALTRRNNCGHPSSIIYEESTLNHHLEILINNVYLKY